MTRPAGVSVKPAGVKLRPTRLGAAFLGLVLLTLVGCINYSLSLGYGLTFLLGGVWVITAAQALRAVRLLSVTVLPPAQAVAGHPLEFTAQVQQIGPAGNIRVVGRARQDGKTTGAVQASGVARPHEVLNLALRVPAPVRGPLHLTHVQVVAVDLLGLWQAALPVPDSASVLVAPRPEDHAPAPPALNVTGTGEAGGRTAGHDEFAGVRAYQPGDSPRLISWKHVARTGTLLTREFDAPAGKGLNLDWNETAALGDVEARVSRLTAWVSEAQKQGLAFRLRLPDFTLDAGQGEGHVRAALNALAQVRPLPHPPESSGTTRPLFAPLQPDALPAGALRFSLLALAFSFLPALTQWPAWVTLLLAGVLGYAALQADPRRLPGLPTVALALLAVLAAVVLNASFGTLLGQQAGTAILAVLLTLKAAETRTYRDAKLLSLLGLFLLVTNFFHSQGPVTALHTLLATALLLAAAARWVNPQTWAGPLWTGRALRQAGRLMLLAAPLAALLFSFFPRPDGPLWRLPIQQNRTGLSDEINAGEFSNLARDNSVAFRADFTGGPVPPPAQRYWRGPVYENYDGLKWTQAVRASFTFAAPSLELVAGQPTYRYALTLEPHGKPWLLALEAVTQAPRNALITTGLQAVTLRPASQRTRFDLQSQVALLGRREDTRRLALNLYVPAGQNPRAAALAAGWRALPPAERVQKASQYLASGGFNYTLDPPTLPEENRIDAFLFSSKRGFCEHYASAFAFLMRSAGVPARVVGGYQGGERNPDGQYLIVRQQDAHAWTEVWLTGQGWVRVDPTALIAPARINTNLGTALTQPNATTARPRTTWQQLALRLDTFQNNWNNWVAGYDGQQQRTLLSRLGVGGVGSAPYMLALLAGAALLLLPIFALVRRSVRPTDPAHAALFDLTEKLNLPRQPGETATSYAERAAQQYPTLQAPLQEIARLFNESRYAPQVGKGHVQRLQTLIRALRRPCP